MKPTRFVLIGVLLLIVAAVAVRSFVDYKKDSEKADSNSSVIEFKSQEPPHISLEYDNGLVTTSDITDEDKADNVILRLKEKSGSSSPFLVTLRYETDLAKAATIVKQPLLDYLESSAKLNLSKKPGFNLVKSSHIKINKRESLELVFDSLSNNQALVARQRLIIIPINNDTAAYIAMQSLSDDFSNIDNKIFDKILKTVDI